MNYVKIENGSLVGGPYEMTDDRTASPNSGWGSEQMALHGFVPVSLDCLDGEKVDYEHPIVSDGSVTFPRIPKTQDEITAEKCKEFDYTLFEGRAIQTLPQERWFQLSLLGIHYTMNRLVEFPGMSVDNFKRFNEYIAGLVASSVLTVEEVSAIKALFLEQGVNLDQIGV